MPSPPEPASPGSKRPDPQARRSPFLFGAFRWYLHWYFWRKFHAVRLSRSGIPAQHAGRPLLIYSNHPGWWDPALLLLALPKILPGRRGYGPMDAEALGRYRLFERMGTFGIDQRSPNGARSFLRISRALLAAPDTMLCITAEGGFRDVRARPLSLRPGLAHVARQAPHALVLPLAIEYCFWNESRPEALLRFGAPVDTAGMDMHARQARLETALAGTMDGLAQEAMTRNTGLFLPLLRGTAGVGGIYDLWRASLAALSGRRFDPSHEPHPR